MTKYVYSTKKPPLSTGHPQQPPLTTALHLRHERLVHLDEPLLHLDIVRVSAMAPGRLDEQAFQAGHGLEGRVDLGREDLPVEQAGVPGGLGPADAQGPEVLGGREGLYERQGCSGAGDLRADVPDGVAALRGHGVEEGLGGRVRLKVQAVCAVEEQRRLGLRAPARLRHGQHAAAAGSPGSVPQAHRVRRHHKHLAVYQQPHFGRYSEQDRLRLRVHQVVDDNVR